MEARLADQESEISATGQRLQEGVTISAWPDEEVFRKAPLARVDPSMPRPSRRELTPVRGTSDQVGLGRIS